MVAKVSFVEKVITTGQRWMQFLITSGTIIGGTTLMTWGMLTFAMDTKFVTDEEFGKFKEEVTASVARIETSTQTSLDDAVMDLKCEALRQRAAELETTATFKESVGQSAALERSLRQNIMDGDGMSRCLGRY